MALTKFNIDFSRYPEATLKYSEERILHQYLSYLAVYPQDEYLAMAYIQGLLKNIPLRNTSNSYLMWGTKSSGNFHNHVMRVTNSISLDAELAAKLNLNQVHLTELSFCFISLKQDEFDNIPVCPSITKLRLSTFSINKNFFYKKRSNFSQIHAKFPNVIDLDLSNNDFGLYSNENIGLITVSVEVEDITTFFNDRDEYTYVKRTADNAADNKVWRLDFYEKSKLVTKNIVINKEKTYALKTGLKEVYQNKIKADRDKDVNNFPQDQQKSILNYAIKYHQRNHFYTELTTNFIQLFNQLKVLSLANNFLSDFSIAVIFNNKDIPYLQCLDLSFNLLENNISAFQHENNIYISQTNFFRELQFKGIRWIDTTHAFERTKTPSISIASSSEKLSPRTQTPDQHPIKINVQGNYTLGIFDKNLDCYKVCLVRKEYFSSNAYKSAERIIYLYLKKNSTLRARIEHQYDKTEKCDLSQKFFAFPNKIRFIDSIISDVNIWPKRDNDITHFANNTQYKHKETELKKMISACCQSIYVKRPTEIEYKGFFSLIGADKKNNKLKTNFRVQSILRERKFISEDSWVAVIANKINYTSHAYILVEGMVNGELFFLQYDFMPQGPAGIFDSSKGMPSIHSYSARYFIENLAAYRFHEFIQTKPAKIVEMHGRFLKRWEETNHFSSVPMNGDDNCYTFALDIIGCESTFTDYPGLNLHDTHRSYIGGKIIFSSEKAIDTDSEADRETDSFNESMQALALNQIMGVFDVQSRSLNEINGDNNENDFISKLRQLYEDSNKSKDNFVVNFKKAYLEKYFKDINFINEYLKFFLKSYAEDHDLSALEVYIIDMVMFGKYSGNILDLASKPYVFLLSNNALDIHYWSVLIIEENTNNVFYIDPLQRALPENVKDLLTRIKCTDSPIRPIDQSKKLDNNYSPLCVIELCKYYFFSCNPVSTPTDEDGLSWRHNSHAETFFKTVKNSGSLYDSFRSIINEGQQNQQYFDVQIADVYQFFSIRAEKSVATPEKSNAFRDRSNIFVNSDYQYEDNDITAILMARLQQIEALTPVEVSQHRIPILVYAAIDTVSDNQLLQRLKQDQKNESGKHRCIIIPSNLGLSHWIGIGLEIDENEHVVRAAYIDSLSKKNIELSSSFKVLKKQFDFIYANYKLSSVELLTQKDATSCGVFMIENLLLFALNSSLEKSDDANSIRKKHLDCLKEYNPAFHEKFYKRQKYNKITVENLPRQWSYQKAISEVKFSLREQMRILTISSGIHALSNDTIKDTLWDALTISHVDEDIQPHLNRIRSAFLQILSSNHEVKNKKELSNLTNIIFLIDKNYLDDLISDKELLNETFKSLEFYLTYNEIKRVALYKNCDTKDLQLCLKNVECEIQQREEHIQNLVSRQSKFKELLQILRNSIYVFKLERQTNEILSIAFVSSKDGRKKQAVNIDELKNMLSYCLKNYKEINIKEDDDDYVIILTASNSLVIDKLLELLIQVTNCIDSKPLNTLKNQYPSFFSRALEVPQDSNIVDAIDCRLQ